MKICAIGDIHGTTKFLDCYMNILDNEPDCEKIIVCGDHFDPYENISVDEQLEKYNEFIDICKKDVRVISLLGNHDLATYILYNDQTNRTSRNPKDIERIGNAVMKNLPNSYLAYKINDYIFSHAGVSQVWLDDIDKYGMDYVTKIMNNHKGWGVDDLQNLVAYYPMDWSGYGDNAHQGCTWIRPNALNQSAIEGYNQVIGHTQVEDIVKVTMNNGKDLWLIDNQRKSEYLTLNLT